MIEATLKRLEESRSDAPPELFVEGVVRKESGGFVVSLVLRDPSGRGLGEREVRVERQSCKDVEGTGALVLALMIAVARPNLVAPPGTQGDAAATPSTIAPEAPSPEAPSPEAASPAPLRTPPGRPPAKSAVVHAPVAFSPAELPLRVLVGAGGSASVGVLPGAGLGVGVRAMVAPWSPVLIGVEATLDSDVTVPSHGGEVGFAMLGAPRRASGYRPCKARSSSSSLRRRCAAGSSGRLHGTSATSRATSARSRSPESAYSRARSSAMGSSQKLCLRSPPCSFGVSSRSAATARSTTCIASAPSKPASPLG